MGANKAVERYMETFVREAIARSAYERIEVKGKGPGALEVSFICPISSTGELRKRQRDSEAGLTWHCRLRI
jgi:hypothetical protein